MLNFTNHQGNTNQNHNELSPHTCQNGYYQKDKKQQVLTRMWRKGNKKIRVEINEIEKKLEKINENKS